MKLDAKTQKVDREGVDVEKSFGIMFNAKAAQILSSALYKDKIGAVVRELSANAHDAHVQAGKVNTPFELTLPSSWDSIFAVRDFGLGLSDADILTLYTTYFQSSKSSSNDFVGAFGLGSKSPFAYTDSFSVISFHGGMKRTYSAFKREDGMPSMARLHEEPTTETGLLVQVPVNSMDVSHFHTSVMTQLKFFDPLPSVKGRKIEWPKIKIQKEGTDWILYERTGSYYDERKPSVIMGNISYPLDPKHLKSQHAATILQRTPFVFKLPIGSVDLTPSREDLEYNTRTINRIIKATDLAETEFYADVNKSLADCKTKWEAEKLWQTYAGYGGILYNIQRKFKWNGAELTGQIKYTTPHTLDKNNNKIYEDLMFRSTGSQWFGQIAPPKRLMETAWNESIYINAVDDISFVIVDELQFWGKLRWQHTQKPFKSTIILLKGSDTQIDKFLKEVGIPADLVTRLSTIVVPEEESFAIKAVTAKIKKMVTSSGMFSRWEDTALTYKDAPIGQFLWLYKNEVWTAPTDQGGVVYPGSIHSIVQLVEHYQEAGKLPSITVYGIPGTYHSQFKRVKGWTPILEKLQELIQEEAKDSGLLDVLAQYQIDKKFNASALSSLYNKLLRLAGLNPDIARLGKPLIDYMNSRPTISVKHKGIVDRADSLNLKLMSTPNTKVVDPKDLWEAFPQNLREIVTTLHSLYGSSIDTEGWKTVVSHLKL